MLKENNLSNENNLSKEKQASKENNLPIETKTSKDKNIAKKRNSNKDKNSFKDKNKLKDKKIKDKKNDINILPPTPFDEMNNNYRPESKKIDMIEKTPTPNIITEISNKNNNNGTNKNKDSKNIQKSRNKLPKNNKRKKLNLSQSVDAFDIHEIHHNNKMTNNTVSYNNKHNKNNNYDNINYNDNLNHKQNYNNYTYNNKLNLIDKPPMKRRQNSIDALIRQSTDFSTSKKINSMKFENGISCLAEINEVLFGAGNLIGDLKIIEKNSFKEIQTISEHNGTINSIFIMQDNSILTASADHTMKKIILSSDFINYRVLFVFEGYENYVFKGVELINKNIISCSWDNKLYLWENKDINEYENTLRFNEGQRVEDIIEISENKFASISEDELKIWSSLNMNCLKIIKLVKGIATPNSLCKLNDSILIAIYFHSINIIDIKDYCLLSTIDIDIGNLSCITKLNDGSILIAEDINTDYYCIFYLKQYILQKDELRYIAYRKDKFLKTNKNNDKEVRALIQFADGVIAQGITGEYDGKDQGDIFFYN